MNITGRIEKIFDAYVNDLEKLVSIPSVMSEALDSAPFGRAIDDALMSFLEVAKNLGFTTYKDPEGYYGYAEIGEGDEMIGILGHVDIVPAGDLEVWNTDPFKATIIDGKMHGRGTQDDKGPTLASMYALKALIDEGISLNKKVRFIFGTDEETLWRGIIKYQEKERMPDYGFSPDSKFPLIYAEKGLLQAKLVGKNNSNLRMAGGDAFNSVPSKMLYKSERQEALEEALKKRGFDYHIKDEGVEVVGKSVHAQAAETGINAINRLALALSDIGESSKAIDFISELIGEDAFGTNIFGVLEDEVSGKLKCNIGKIELGDAEEVLSVDMRIPVTIDKEMVVEKLKAAAVKYGLEYKEHDYLRSIYVPLESKLIKTLMGAYQEVTGDLESEPVSSGGATYARAMDQCVAFGAVLPGSPKTEHQPNEFIILGDMKIAMEVYAKAIQMLLEN